jgi:hypothetical protein
MPVFKGGIYLLFCFKEEKMKRFWLVLLSLGLVMAFSVSALAVDVKVSGEYYAAGLYLNKIALPDATTSDVDTAFYFQRLRVGTDFIVSPCLKLVTRFDALERIWGGQRSPVGIADPQGAGTRAENENIAFDVAYIDYTSPIGLFQVGYMPDYIWGTVFGNRAKGPTAGQIKYIVPVGPVTLIAGYAKEKDNSLSAVTASPYVDNDYDSYRLASIFNFNANQAKGEVGVLLLYERAAGNKPFAPAPPSSLYGYMTYKWAVQPYFKAKVGPVDMQGEFHYIFGDAVKQEYPTAAPANISISAIDVFLDATANLGPVYVGGSFAFLSGDDPGTKEKMEGGGAITAGYDWDPCLIMFNNDVVNYWIGAVPGYTTAPGRTSVAGPMSNAWFVQGRVGVKAIPQLDAMLSVSYAKADRKPEGFIGDAYGWEVDATGTYKITNNLSYMLGIGYLFTGDYYKGISGSNELVDNYMLINKLTLSF